MIYMRHPYPLCKSGHRDHFDTCFDCERDRRKLEWRRMRHDVIRERSEMREALRLARQLMSKKCK